MEATSSYRPRISRETRLLLATAAVAVAALWVLARLRFPDLPATPNPVPPLLSQLAAPLTLDGLASEVFQLQARLSSGLVVLDAMSLAPATDTRTNTPRVIGLRVRDDVVLTVAPKGWSVASGPTDRVLALDRPSGLAVVRVAAQSPVSSISRWAPARIDRPQFLMVTEASSDRATLRPAYVSSLRPVVSALWPDHVWECPESTEIARGAFVFTTGGDLVGVVAEYGARQVIVPSTIVFAEVERLAKHPFHPAGEFGVRVQALTPSLAAATGAQLGVVVSTVDATGSAASALRVGDVIEAADGLNLTTPEQWYVHVARVNAGDLLQLRIRRQGVLQDVSVTAPPPAIPIEPTGQLGLRMRRVPRSGTEVLAVEPASVAAFGGLAAGDMITLIGEVTSPTPTDVRSVFSAAPHGKPVLVTVRRGATNLVTTLTR